ncbi:hypothetical protein QM588_01255 [Rhodococcus sp. IEGM 1354]|nr:DUF4235 domain-containing protein [Rhodococcus sp. IEGM 1354]MDI9929015.1 hypothetical protein [Rhodococcus sp. IEGM 1354]
MLIAAAVHGAVFGVVKAAVDRQGYRIPRHHAREPEMAAATQ